MISSEFNFNSVYLIARMEFYRFVKHPFVLVIFGILLVLAVLNGVGGSSWLPYFALDNAESDVFLSVGMSQIMYTSALFCTTLAVFIGLMTFANERSKGSLLTLLTKPMFRRDIVAGKFIGINTFMLTLITINIVFCSLLIMLFYRAPVSFNEFAIRLFTVILLLFLECCLANGLAMLIGIVFKNTLIASIVATTYLYVDWYVSPTNYISALSLLSPKYVFFDIFLYNPQIKLLDTSLSYGNWLNMASPYIIFTLLEIIAITALNCIILSRSEE